MVGLRSAGRDALQPSQGPAALAGSRGGLGLLGRRRAHGVFRTAAGLPNVDDVARVEVGACSSPKSPGP